jgi:hypothetical protein
MGEPLKTLTPGKDFESPAHLAVATAGDAKVVPLFGQGHAWLARSIALGRGDRT